MPYAAGLEAYKVKKRPKNYDPANFVERNVQHSNLRDISEVPYV